MASMPPGVRLVRPVFDLEPWQRHTVLVCFFLIPAAKIAIRVTRVAKLERIINRRYADRTSGQGDAAIRERGTKLAHIVRVVGSYRFFKANCLERSLVLWYLLKRSGVPAEIHFGARKNGAALEAHAWVEYRGTILDEQDELIPQFARFEKPLVGAE